MVECIKHGECSTGFCDDGLCRKPYLLDPCRGGGCPSDMVCFHRSQRCLYKNIIKDQDDKCLVYIDCEAGYYCDIDGSCRRAPGVGSQCSPELTCEDGAKCNNGTCLKLCDLSGKSRFKCGVGEKCSNLISYDPNYPLGLCEKDKDAPPAKDDQAKSVEPTAPVSIPSQVPDPIPAPEPKFYQNPIYIGVALAVAVLLTALVTFCCVKKCGRKPKKEAKAASYAFPEVAPPPYPVDAVPQFYVTASNDKKQ